MFDFPNGCMFKLSPCDPRSTGRDAAPLMIQAFSVETTGPFDAVGDLPVCVSAGSAGFRCA